MRKLPEPLEAGTLNNGKDLVFQSPVVGFSVHSSGRGARKWRARSLTTQDFRSGRFLR